jgi:RND family efflux transporter MFP subunit
MPETDTSKRAAGSVDHPDVSPFALPVAVKAAPDVPTGAPQRRGRLRTLVIGLGVAAMVAAVLLLPVWSGRPVPVAAEVVTLAPVTRVLAVNGRIAVLHSIDVRPLVGGRIAEIPVAEGDRVQLGAVVARIDPTTQQTIVRQAIAGLDAAVIARDQAREAYDRALALGEFTPRASLEAADSALGRAEQEVTRLAALVEQAQAQLADLTIRAPLSGTILRRPVEPGSSVTPTSVLMTIADLGQAVVEADVDEAFATQIRSGQPAVLRLVGETRLHDGLVVRVADQVDPATGALALRIAFAEPVTAPIGLTVAANIVVQEHEAAMTVPRTALLSEAGESAVLIMRDGIAVRRAVRVIDWPSERLVVTDGLEPGDVVIRDATGVSAGQPVRAEAS